MHQELNDNPMVFLFYASLSASNICACLIDELIANGIRGFGRSGPKFVKRHKNNI
jgi:hypothetical protein